MTNGNPKALSFIVADDISTHKIALIALDEALSDQIKLRFAAIFLNGAGSPEVLQHFQNGLRVLHEIHQQAITIVMKEFPDKEKP